MKLLLALAFSLSLGLARAPAASAPSAPSVPLLESAVQSWLGERDHWAFTQRAVEYDGGTPHERVERFDPSLPDDQRWKLLTIDGRPPTAEQHTAWAQKKIKKKRRRVDTPIGKYFDFAHARQLAETEKLIRYDVPLHSEVAWLVPVDKVRVIVTVNKRTRGLEHLNAYVREPFKVALGLAKITGGDADLSFLNFDASAAAEPGSTEPKGSATVTMSKFGERVDFTWSEFRRVSPFKAAASPAPNAPREALTHGP